MLPSSSQTKVGITAGERGGGDVYICLVRKITLRNEKCFQFADISGLFISVP